MPRRLIVNADDYGHTPGTSAGIRNAHLEGIVTTTTTMMNTRDAVPALKRAMEETPKLGVGVHLILTHGAPILPAEQVPTLLEANGMFPDLPALYALGPKMDKAQLKAEWRAQIEAFLQTGATIDHIDSHHHAAFMFENTLSVLFDLAQEYDAPVRHPFSGTHMHDGEQKVAHKIMATTLMKLSPVTYPDSVILEFYSMGVSFENLMRILDALPDGTHELMAHPAILDDEIMQATSYNTMRKVELDLLTDPRIVQHVRDCGIELVTFRDL
jgi:chitin disaccharide deacetylase